MAEYQRKVVSPKTFRCNTAISGKPWGHLGTLVGTVVLLVLQGKLYIYLVSPVSPQKNTYRVRPIRTLSLPVPPHYVTRTSPSPHRESKHPLSICVVFFWGHWGQALKTPTFRCYLAETPVPTSVPSVPTQTRKRRHTNEKSWGHPFFGVIPPLSPPTRRHFSPVHWGCYTARAAGMCSNPSENPPHPPPRPHTHLTAPPHHPKKIR